MLAVDDETQYISFHIHIHGYLRLSRITKSSPLSIAEYKI